MYPRLFQFGHIAIPTYGVFSALALVAALAMAMHTARRLALDPNKIWNLSLTGIFTMLIGSRLLLILFHFSDFIAHPFWMIGLVSIRGHGIRYGAAALAICACIGYIFAARLPLRRTCDCLAPAAALGIAIGSLGAFAAGSDYGSPTTLPWGVVYRHALATLWSGAPLGVRLHPVQAYEAAVALLLFAALLLRLPQRAQDGELAGIFLSAYGTGLYFLDFYHGKRDFVFAGAVSVEQVFGLACLLAGAALCLRRRQATQGVG